MRKNSFFALLSRMKYITRWGLMRNARMETLSEHTLDTAYIAHVLALLDGADAGRVVLCALYHDCSEILTGDMPTPVKYQNDAIRATYKDVEAQAARRLLATLPDTLSQQYAPHLFEQDARILALVKAADKLSALIKCMEEVQMGNHDFERAMQGQLDTLKAMNLPAVDTFIRDYLPAYSLTLDEMSEA